MSDQPTGYTTYTERASIYNFPNIIRFSDLPGVALYEWLPQAYIPFRYTAPLGGITPIEGPEHNTVRCFYALSTARTFLEEQAK